MSIYAIDTPSASQLLYQLPVTMRVGREERRAATTQADIALSLSRGIRPRRNDAIIAVLFAK